MYLPRMFRETDPARCFDLIEAYPFGSLIVHGEAGIEIAHAPLLVDRDESKLRFHLARANPAARALVAASPEILIELRGPDAYVSPRWYEQPNVHVPTWNYAVVHVRGRCSPPLNDAELTNLLADLAARFERDQPDPWSLADLDPTLLAELLPHIVGFAVEILSIDAKLKLSQNRGPEDRRRVLEAHARSDDPHARALAEMMAALRG